MPERIDPAAGPRLWSAPDSTPGVDDALQAAASAQPDWAAAGPRTRRRARSCGGRARQGAGRDREPDHGRHGQDVDRERRRARRGDRLPALCRGGGATQGGGRQSEWRAGSHELYPARPARRRRCYHGVELSCRYPTVEARGGAAHRQHMRLEAGVGDRHDGDPARRCAGSSWAAPRRAQSRSRTRLGHR